MRRSIKFFVKGWKANNTLLHWTSMKIVLTHIVDKKLAANNTMMGLTKDQKVFICNSLARNLIVSQSNSAANNKNFNFA